MQWNIFTASVDIIRLRSNDNSSCRIFNSKSNLVFFEIDLFVFTILYLDKYLNICH